MRIAHFGTFDVQNYGDLLFPLVIENRLSQHQLIHVSPVGGAAVYPDSVVSVDLSAASKQQFDAVIIGGGNIINVNKHVIPDYQAIANTAYPSLWIGASALAYEQGIPLVINAPSVSDLRHDKGFFSMLSAFVAGASYAAFRDSSSCSLVKNIKSSVTPRNVPDTAFDVSLLWDKKELEERVAAHGIADTRYIVFHVNRRYLFPSIADVAKSIESICAEIGATPVFIVIGPCHGDIETAQRVATLIEIPCVVVNPKLVCDVAAVISKAMAYFGSSMHGYITALSFGKMAKLVLSDRPHHKFSGLIEHVGLLPSSVVSSWTAIELKEVEMEFAMVDVGRTIRHSLDRHWMAVENAILRGRSMTWPVTLDGWEKQFNKVCRSENNTFTKMMRRSLNLFSQTFKKTESLLNRDKITKDDQVKYQKLICNDSLMKSPLVYIIILCWNGKQWLKACLSSVNSTQYPNFRVLLVDNGSTDGSKEYVNDCFPEVELLINKKNLGYAEGNNRGIRFALQKRANYIALLNQDIKVEPDWLKNLIEIAEQEAPLGILSPMQYNYEGTALDKNFWLLINENKDLKKHRNQGKLHMMYELPRVIGSAMVIKRTVCEKVGLFDPMYFCYHEETDLCRRARYHGFKIGIVTNSKVYHWHQLIQKGNKNKKATYLFYRNMAVYTLKNPFKSFCTNLKSYFWWGGAWNVTCSIYRDTGNVVKAILSQLWVVSHLPLIFCKRYKERRKACYMQHRIGSKLSLRRRNRL